MALADELSYLFTGTLYKSPIIQNIIHKLLNRTDSLSLLDLGGGCGATSYDVATFSKFKNKSVTLRDICLPYLVLSQQLFNANTDISFSCSRGLMHTGFESYEAYNVVLFIGSLLYVEKP